MNDNRTTAGPAQDRRLGTFAGVFTPSILTILGVILFLRAGFVVGEGGVRGALLVLLLAEGIVVLTALSVAGISTNTQVHGGGAYYLISRVLGPEFGGAIGLTLFLAQSLSVPFYILGFAEALAVSFPAIAPFLRLICLTTARRAVYHQLSGCEMGGQCATGHPGGAGPVDRRLHGRPRLAFRSRPVPGELAGVLLGRHGFLGAVRHLFPGGHRHHGRHQHVGQPARSGPLAGARHASGRCWRGS
jgi:hypothetical protein